MPTLTLFLPFVKLRANLYNSAMWHMFAVVVVSITTPKNSYSENREGTALPCQTQKCRLSPIRFVIFRTSWKF